MHISSSKHIIYLPKPSISPKTILSHDIKDFGVMFWASKGKHPSERGYDVNT
jgi:hypothetical protein